MPLIVQNQRLRQSQRPRFAPWLLGVGLALMATGPAMAAPESAPSAPTVAASATAAPISLHQVQVQGTSIGARDVKTVGQLLKAEALFEKDRALAPHARFEFKVYGRRNAEQSADVDLGLQTAQGRIPVNLDADGRFSIDAARRTLDGDTEIRSRLRDGAVTWRPYITTPGSTERLRRLGDLRLQCRAGFYSGVARSSGLWLINTLKLLSVPELDGCAQESTGWSNFSDAPVFGVRLRFGDQVQDLSQGLIGGLNDGEGSSYDWGFALRDRLFRLPMGDKRWPDDTLVEFEFMDDPQQPVDAELLALEHPLVAASRALVPQLSTWDALQAQLGRPRNSFQYASGWRVVRYEGKWLPAPASASEERAAGERQAGDLPASAPATPAAKRDRKQRSVPSEQLELALLFDDSDRLVKYALRKLGLRRQAKQAELPWRAP